LKVNYFELEMRAFCIFFKIHMKLKNIASLCLMTAVLVVWACSPQEDLVAVGGVNIKDEEQVSAFLRGTWSREYVEENFSIQKTLSLKTNGDFVEKVSISAPNLEPELHEHSGTWFYDGTNIKRTYLLMDGRAPSRLNLPYVTFEVKIKSKNEFLGIDHIHHHEVRYVRLPE